MEKNNIRMDLRLRIKEYLRYCWNEEKNTNYEEEIKILSILPMNLRQEFLLASYGSILNETPLFFENFSKKCLRETIYQGCIKHIKFSPGDIIFDVNIDNFLIFHLKII